MDFAKNLLQKYGWKEGEGLGKDKAGISAPLKPHLKFDQTGLGHNKADEFNNHWWERVYDNAANNIDVNKDKNDVSIHLKKGKSVEISTKHNGHKKDAKGQTYSGVFLKTSTLTNTGEEVEIPDKEDREDVYVKGINVLSDEDLFRACNGRTAHKGARHSLTLSGKLNRIEEQEKEFLKKFDKTIEISETSDRNNWTEVKDRKHKKAIFAETPEEDESSKVVPLIYSNDYLCKSKKKQKLQKKIDKTMAELLMLSCNTSDTGTDIQKKKKSKSERTDKTSDDINAVKKVIKKKKKSKKKFKESTIDAITTELINEKTEDQCQLNNIAHTTNIKVNRKSKVKLDETPSDIEELCLPDDFDEETVQLSDREKDRAKRYTDLAAQYHKQHNVELLAKQGSGKRKKRRKEELKKLTKKMKKMMKIQSTENV